VPVHQVVRKLSLLEGKSFYMVAHDYALISHSGSGATGALEGLREAGFKGSITVLSAEDHTPIDRTKLSKALIADPSKIALRDQAFYKSASVDFITDATVTSIDFKEKTVSTAGAKSFPYTKLILASGGTPKKLPMEGFKTLSNIFVLRSIKDVQEILAAVGDKGKNIAIIGSSFIGMEVGNALAKENNVTIIGMEKTPLERVMGNDVGALFQKQLEANGAKFKMGASVEKALPSKSDPKAVGAIHLGDGTDIPADLVILGVGVAPSTEYLKDNPAVTLEKDGSLMTDETFEVKDLKGVYAIGDIATYPYHGPGGDGKPVRIEHWNVAQNAGRRAASDIVDPQSGPKPFIPIFWSALGSQLRYCGNTVNGYDDLVLNKDGETKFVAYYTKGEEVVAVATMGVDPVMSQVSELMRRGKMITKSEVKKGVDVLSISLPAETKI
jgi:NADPH-dependent 2,4-dienoyl-CoA reductase/sulfur reductase-like enzyme